MEKVMKCYGCGAIIQSEDEKHIGYVPKQAINHDHVLCQRCFQLKNYHRLQDTHMSKDDFLEILGLVGEKDCLVVYMIDLFDFQGSLIQGLIGLFLNYPVSQHHFYYFCVQSLIN